MIGWIHRAQRHIFGTPRMRNDRLSATSGTRVQGGFLFFAACKSYASCTILDHELEGPGHCLVIRNAHGPPSVASFPPPLPPSPLPRRFVEPGLAIMRASRFHLGHATHTCQTSHTQTFIHGRRL